MSYVESITLPLASRALDASALRHQMIALNIANASLPGAQRLQVQFESLMNGIKPSYGDIPRPQTVLVGGPIHLDREMSDLAANGLHYQALVKALGRQLSIVSIAMQEARR